LRTGIYYWSMVVPANDSADLLIALRNASWNDSSALQRLLASQLEQSSFEALLAPGRESMGEVTSLYMQTLAENLAGHVQDLLAAGASRIVLLNLPDVSKPPRFNQPELSWIKPYVSRWTQRFNDELQRNFAKDKRVLLVDFYAEFNRQVANPKQYGFSNALVACPAVGEVKTARYDLAVCTDKNLTTHIPQGERGSNWWQRYMFSDDFHPTPYGHQQMADMVLKALKQAG